MMSAFDNSMSGAWMLHETALDGRARREVGEILESADECRAAIRIARIIHRIDADVDVLRAR